MKFGTKYILLMTLCVLPVCFEHTAAMKEDNVDYTLNLFDVLDEKKIITVDPEYILQKYPETKNPALVKLPKNLESLDLSWTNITTEDLNNILAHCPNIEALDLSGCKKIVWEHVRWGYLKNLEALVLSRTDITAAALNTIFESCQKLEKLAIFFSNVGVVWEHVHWGYLRALYLRWTDITADGLNNILQSCPTIEELDLSGCKKIAWEHVRWGYLINLRALELSGTGITTEDLNKILKCCPNIKALNLQDCKKIVW